MDDYDDFLSSGVDVSPFIGYRESESIVEEYLASNPSTDLHFIGITENAQEGQNLYLAIFTGDKLLHVEMAQRGDDD